MSDESLKERESGAAPARMHYSPPSWLFKLPNNDDYNASNKLFQTTTTMTQRRTYLFHRQTLD